MRNTRAEAALPLGGPHTPCVRAAAAGRGPDRKIWRVWPWSQAWEVGRGDLGEVRRVTGRTPAVGPAWRAAPQAPGGPAGGRTVGRDRPGLRRHSPPPSSRTGARRGLSGWAAGRGSPPGAPWAAATHPHSRLQKKALSRNPASWCRVTPERPASVGSGVGGFPPPWRLPETVGRALGRYQLSDGGPHLRPSELVGIVLSVV